MKAATFITFMLLLVVCVVVMHAQNNAAPSGDVTMSISEGTPEYCLGEISAPLFGGGSKRGPDDITLQLPLKLIYENHRRETIILPSWVHYLTRMTVAGQNGSTVLRNRGNGGMDVNQVMAMSRPNLQFSIIPGGKDAWYSGVEGVVIPVLDRSSGLDLRGNTVQIAMTRDFRSLTPDVVGKLNEKWKDYGTVWTGVAESDTLTFQIPKEPETQSCITLVAK
jgi:hypothetical protein